MKQQIDDIITQMLKEFAAQIEAEANSLLTSVGLGSIKPTAEIKQGAMGAEFSLSLPGYDVFVEYGVKGTESVPEGAENSPFQFKNNGVSKDMISSIRQWAGSKGIVAKPRNTALQGTQTRKKLKESVADLDTQLAFAIAKNVKKKGISPKKVLEQTLTDERMQALADAIATRLQNEATVWLLGK